MLEKRLSRKETNLNTLATEQWMPCSKFTKREITIARKGGEKVTMNIT
ncbi:MAG: hypothetical protein Q6354_04685 [Candidatus Brocadiales bacterium]|nr:hypothetical protein [Candidatus Brocadiales bacterium]